MMDVFYDPQTSGGLLVTLETSKKDMFISVCKEKGVSAFYVGEVLEKQAENIIIQ